MNTRIEQPNEKLKSLFIDLIKADLYSYIRVSDNMLNGTIKHYSEVVPFNNWSFQYWVNLCAKNEITTK